MVENELVKMTIKDILEDYVRDFVGCSHGVASTKARLFKILHPEENEDAEK